jgi:hypothetical protein
MLRPFSIHILGWLFLTLGITVGRVLADGNPIVSTYETKGLGRDTMVWCATHSADGTMYFGGDRLYISDGDSWQSYAMGSTYAVRSLEFGDDGKLWASGYDELGWFEKKSDATWEYHSLRGKVPASVSKLGDVWNKYRSHLCSRIHSPPLERIIFSGIPIRCPTPIGIYALQQQSLYF